MIDGRLLPGVTVRVCGGILLEDEPKKDIQIDRCIAIVGNLLRCGINYTNVVIETAAAEL